MKAAVIGLGNSNKFFKPDGYDFTVGVNDVYKYFKTDYLVCVDHKHRFTEDRRKVILESRPKKFYSHCLDWQDMPNYEKIRCLSHVSVDDGIVQCSNNSTHVAAVMAYKLGAKEIHLHGVDFTQDHKYFKNDAPRNSAIKRFKELHDELKSKGVSLKVYHMSSKLSSVLPIVRK